MDKDKIIDYVMNSPANTNRAVLEGMLDSANQGGGTEPVSGMFVIHGDGDGHINEHFADAYNAFTEGRVVVFDAGESGFIHQLVEINSNYMKFVNFDVVVGSDDDLIIYIKKVNEDDTYSSSAYRTSVGYLS